MEQQSIINLEEFTNLEQGKFRTSEQEQYLKNLYEKLAFLTEQGGSELAEVLLKTVETTTMYKKSIGGITKEELVKEEFDLISRLHTLHRLPSYKKKFQEQERLHSILEELINFLENNKELTLSEDEYKYLRGAIEKGNFTDELRPKFWEICIDRFIKKEDMESVFSGPLEEFKLLKLEKVIQESNNKEFIYNSFQLIVLSGMIGKISQETNIKFFNTLFIDSEDKARILKGFASTECKNLKECLEKINPQMKEVLKLELKNEKTLMNIFKEVRDVSYLGVSYDSGNLLTLLETLGVTITSSLLLSFDDELKCVTPWDLARLRKLMPDVEIKNALNEMFEEGDEKYVVELTYLFRNNILWGYVDENYRTPKYLNLHMKIISEDFGLSDEDRIGLLNDLKKSEDIGEKYNACLVTDEMIKNADEKLIDLIIDTVELDETSNSRLLYTKMERTGKVDEETMLNIIKNISRTSSFEEYNDLINTIKQGVYSTENREMIVEFIKNFWYFYKICSKEEIDTFITKFIHVISDKDIKISDKDVKIFKDIILNISSPLLFKIKCFMGYVDVSKCDSLPKDVYIDAIKNGKLGLYTEQLPKVDVDSPDIDPKDLNKLLEILKDYDDKRSEENVNNLVEKVIRGGENREVIFNFTSETDQKFVLSFDYEEQCLKFLTEALVNHSLIHKKYIKDGKCFGGGFVEIDKENKIITLSGFSQDYGYVEGEYKKAMKKMLEKKFPDYQIICK